ncbi:unnamed protein product [Zymoseptoria tritici ST99CH_1E4]|uniref:Zn(2)-C6 fungal-type domain-containing protein n=1 Tax=Zymoseptoria tritici ST99CH_1E4 TaxID=1276532 RepID=A0A2H1H8N3_ZYMTR|nr:unnamed protein product [Zymoseptoria tritici ST99CH_1E4]
MPSQEEAHSTSTHPGELTIPLSTTGLSELIRRAAITLNQLGNPDGEANPEHQTCTLNIPISISVKGPAKFPTYEIRLGDILEGLLKLDNLDLTVQNHQILHGINLADWHEALSSMTLDETKHLLSGPEAPTVNQLLGSLPSVTGEWRPGVYLEALRPVEVVVLDTDDTDESSSADADDSPADQTVDTKEFVYIGSGSKVALGIEVRCQERSRPTYRASEMKKKTCFHYELVDQKGRPRTQSFRKLAVTSFRTKAASDVNGTRALCILQEAVMASWLRSYATHTVKRNQAFVNLGPWTSAPYLGSNCTPPLRQDSQITLFDAKALTPEEWTIRHRQQTRNWRADMDANQKARQTDYNELYNRKIAVPRNQMRARGLSEDEIADFVQEKLDEIHEELPDRKKGSNRRRRPEDIRAEAPSTASSSKRGKTNSADGNGTATLGGQTSSVLPTSVKQTTSTNLVPATQTGSRWYCPRGTRCQRCKEKKERCDGGQPCARCAKSGSVCVLQS